RQNCGPQASSCAAQLACHRRAVLAGVTGVTTPAAVAAVPLLLGAVLGALLPIPPLVPQLGLGCLWSAVLAAVLWRWDSRATTTVLVTVFVLGGVALAAHDRR
ncbi:MAG: hypothetical protein VYE68_02960, partial [Acidobacteriota bacterium]|nr:hypothetical protein [Acidobacteriota bacterium]